MHCLMFSKRFYVQPNLFVWYFPCILRCKCSPFLVYTTSTFLKVHSSFSLIYSFKDCPYHLFMIIRGEKTVDGFLYREKDHSGMKSIMFKKKKRYEKHQSINQTMIRLMITQNIPKTISYLVHIVHSCMQNKKSTRERNIYLHGLRGGCITLVRCCRLATCHTYYYQWCVTFWNAINRTMLVVC
jgi:hypothetical protein